MMPRLAMFIIIIALVVMPVFAQDSTTNTLTFNGFTFSYDTELATNVNIFQDAGIAPTPDTFGFAMPAYTRFVLYQPSSDPVNPRPLPESPFDAEAGIYVFDTADFVGYAEETARFQTLQTLLAERPDLSAFETVDVTLPYLPVYPAGQTFRSQAHYVDTDQLQGIAYITAFQEAAEPLLAHNLFYTVQAISNGGQYYVVLIVPLETSLLPENMDATFDITAFVENLNDYLVQTMAEIDAAAPTDFSPALNSLDAMVETFAFSTIP